MSGRQQSAALEPVDGHEAGADRREQHVARQHQRPELLDADAMNLDELLGITIRWCRVLL